MLRAEAAPAAKVAALNAEIAHKAATSSAAVREVKQSHVISQTHEAETTTLSEDELKVAYGSRGLHALEFAA